MKNILLITAIMFTIACSHDSKSSDPHAGHDMSGHSPGGADYSSMTDREIKALSKDEIDGLSEGKGLGMAMAAELNGYPGPMHVLEFKKELALTDEQVKKTEELFDLVKSESKTLGKEIIEAERNLDALFKEKKVTEENLTASTSDIATLRGRLRATHLKFHLRMMDVLTEEQIAKYQELRGYSKSAK
jgi:Spy/CpxP family protein refolding chaperone